MGSKEPQKYILIEPTTLQDIQAWATNEVVESPLFKPFDEDATRKQIRESAYDLVFAWDKTEEPTTGKALNDLIEKHVDALLQLLGGTTNGK